MTREEAIKYLIKPTITSTFIGEEKQKELNAYNMAIKALEQEPKIGHWILTDDDFVYCSECEDSYYQRPIDASWYYCPHCGAKMVEPQEGAIRNEM